VVKWTGLNNKKCENYGPQRFQEHYSRPTGMPKWWKRHVLFVVGNKRDSISDSSCPFTFVICYIKFGLIKLCLNWKHSQCCWTKCLTEMKSSQELYVLCRQFSQTNKMHNNKSICNYICTIVSNVFVHILKNFLWFSSNNHLFCNIIVSFAYAKCYQNRRSHAFHSKNSIIMYSIPSTGSA
jgi:hypothetical protein